MQDVRVGFPFGRFIVLRVRGIAIFQFPPSLQNQIDLGGRLELMGQSPVFLNLIRLYGGGGPQLFVPVTGVDHPSKNLSFGGGGHFGFEFFLSPRTSLDLEVGGSSGPVAGATVAAGFVFYPF